MDQKEINKEVLDFKIREIFLKLKVEIITDSTIRNLMRKNPRKFDEINGFLTRFVDGFCETLREQVKGYSEFNKLIE